MVRKKNSNTLAENRKARHDYFIEETMETGIALVGTEVKSIRAGKCNLKECYADIDNGEIVIKNMHISHYEQGNIFNVDPLRVRKLLLHKEQIKRFQAILKEQGLTLIPLTLYMKNNKVKVALGLCRGKKSYDKRDTMLEKAHKRDIERELKNSNRN
ncbi:SsrA-binding protein SmpB [Clostridium sp.]|uniref:SsrA-binding protein SmpB n=1 Tax=Clostridium sp. TaxID=1506 RepID=UPI00263225DE|nr:SsrA-binding protein SmpB [Clostridium sp.]